MTLEKMLRDAFGDLYRDLREQLPVHASKRYDRRDLERICKIVVHHSATRPTVSWAAIARYHVHDANHQWPGIGYHFGIEASGAVVYLGDVATVRWHARQANSSSIGVCCLGDYQKTAPPEAMLDSLALLIEVLNAWRVVLFGEAMAWVVGHRVECETTCPGDMLMAALSKLRERQTLDELLLAEAEWNQAFRFNPEAALQRRIFADGFVPNSPEFDVTHDGVTYVAQRAEHLSMGVIRVYYAVRGAWDRVLYVAKKQETCG